MLGLALTAGLGCREASTEPYPVWAKTEEPYRAQAGSGNAFDGYVVAAEEALKLAPEDADRVSFLPSHRRRLVQTLTPALARLERASRSPCRFEHRLLPFDRPNDHQRGWRLLGKALAWRVEAAVEAGDGAQAVTWALVAARFGFGLAEGDATDASLGLTVWDEARAALVPGLPRLPARELERLRQGLAAVFKNGPTLAPAAAHEGRRMLLGVQTVQDAHQRRGHNLLMKTLGDDVRKAVAYLRDLPESKRADYFRRFAAEAKETARQAAEAARLPMADRPQPKEPEGERPWRRFARHYFTTLEPAQRQFDRTLARTRLLAVTAWCLQAVKTTGRAPAGLDKLPAVLTEDPYTGRPFVYASGGPDFKVASVGADLRDDGGETDLRGLEPDLVLDPAEK
jgi:hypothetical protein